MIKTGITECLFFVIAKICQWSGELERTVDGNGNSLMQLVSITADEGRDLSKLVDL